VRRHAPLASVLPVDADVLVGEVTPQYVATLSLRPCPSDSSVSSAARTASSSNGTAALSRQTWIRQETASPRRTSSGRFHRHGDPTSSHRPNIESDQRRAMIAVASASFAALTT
jgi:hypothetical protein